MNTTRRVLAALVLAASAASLCQAEEWTSEAQGPQTAAPVPEIAPPSLGAPACAGPRHPCIRKLWQWATYHGLRTHPICNCQGPRCVLQPYLYEYFLNEHPGCGHCGGPIVPAGLVEASANAGAIQEWDSQPNAEQLPSPRPQSNESDVSEK
jgi:hypothetical protein